MPRGIYKRKSLNERFWEKVNKTNTCWEWISNKNAQGYGKFPVGKNTKRAHRVAWELTNGDIPNGLWVLHKCDNPPCVNPEHLFLGTRSDNMKDCCRKGRYHTGTRFQAGELNPKWRHGKYAQSKKYGG